MTEAVEPVVAPAPRAPEPEKFSREYVQELREEAKTWRLKAQENETAAQTARREAQEAAAAAKMEITTAKTAADQRVITTEARRVLDKAGLVDPDALKLFDLSGLKMNDAGDVEIPDGFIEKARTSKPWAFQTGTSSTAPAPKPGSAPAKRAVDMTPAEISAAAAKHGIKLQG